jgi:hypothetical protein
VRVEKAGEPIADVFALERIDDIQMCCGIVGNFEWLFVSRDFFQC